jgi:hypothetical protein
MSDNTNNEALVAIAAHTVMKCEQYRRQGQDLLCSNNRLFWETQLKGGVVR